MTSIFHHLRHPHDDNDHGPSKKKDFVLEHSPIGIGGYSQVIRAQWKARGGTVVAMKVVRKESIRNREQYLRILGPGFERIHSSSHVCAILDWFETDSKYYLAFPLLTGGELLERMNTRGRFTEDAARVVVRVIVETLAFIHSHGIIHRDIKPDNFLYRTPHSDIGDLVLIDFGLAKVLDHDADGDAVYALEPAGTPGYAAPEVFFGMQYGRNSDLFGVGVITYNLLSAWSPWTAKDSVGLIDETSRAHIGFPSGPFQGVSEEAKSFVNTLLQPPGQRPDARQALHLPWLALPPAPRVQHHEAHHHDAPHALRDPERKPVEALPTLKPEHPVVRHVTAQAMDLRGKTGYSPGFR